MKYFFALYFILTSSWAYQVNSISNSDLRKGKELFNINGHYRLFHMNNNNYILQKDKENFKVSIQYGQSIDKEFVSTFINIKYSLTHLEKRCDKTFELEMRGETAYLCSYHKEQNQIVNQFVELKLDKIIKGKK